MKTNFQTIIGLLTAVIFAGVVVIAVFLGLKRVDLWLKIQSVYLCSQSSKVVYINDGGATITEPYQPSFDRCLEKSGI